MEMKEAFLVISVRADRDILQLRLQKQERTEAGTPQYRER
jgi:hypothetical protein